MKFPALILSFIILFFNIALSASAATVPLVAGPEKSQYPVYRNIATMKLRDFQKLIGRKLTIKEKIAFFILKYKTRHQHNDANTDGKASFVLGFLGLILLIAGFFTPALFLGALLASILAIVIGSTARKKDGNNREARMGKMLGWITLGALSLLAVLLIIVIATWKE